MSNTTMYPPITNPTLLAHLARQPKATPQQLRTAGREADQLIRTRAAQREHLRRLVAAARQEVAQIEGETYERWTQWSIEHPRDARRSAPAATLTPARVHVLRKLIDRAEEELARDLTRRPVYQGVNAYGHIERLNAELTGTPIMRGAGETAWVEYAPTALAWHGILAGYGAGTRA